MVVEVIKTEQTAKKKRVCAYIRVSTQTDDQHQSLTNQRLYFEGYYHNQPDVEFVGKAKLTAS